MIFSLKKEYSIADQIFHWMNFRRKLSFDADNIPDSAKTSDDLRRIRCPKCGWQPRRSSRWYCSSAGAPEFFLEGCGTVWNTFDTGGKCPGCSHQWRWTTCLSCGKDSLHVDWYPNSKDK